MKHCQTRANNLTKSFEETNQSSLSQPLVHRFQSLSSHSDTTWHTFEVKRHSLALNISFHQDLESEVRMKSSWQWDAPDSEKLRFLTERSRSPLEIKSLMQNATGSQNHLFTTLLGSHPDINSQVHRLTALNRTSKWLNCGGGYQIARRKYAHVYFCPKHMRDRNYEQLMPRAHRE